MSTLDPSTLEISSLFDEPQDFYPLSPKPTTERVTLLSGREVSVRLVGHNPLWGHHLWNAGRIVTSYLESNSSIINSKTVLELGAGAGLPSLVCAILGADVVVMTDYPDPDLTENLRYNIENFQSTSTTGDNISIDGRIFAEGYVWGADPTPLLAHLPSTNGLQATSTKNAPGFDILILADLLFNHSEHTKLVSTVRRALLRSPSSKALVFFTPYRPWLLGKDLAFFDIAREAGFVVEKILEEQVDKVMFEEDRGDEGIRRTVYGYMLTWEESLEEKTTLASGIGGDSLISEK